VDSLRSIPFLSTSMEENPCCLEMNPGIGITAEVLAGSQPEEVSLSELALDSWTQHQLA